MSTKHPEDPVTDDELRLIGFDDEDIKGFREMLNNPIIGDGYEFDLERAERNALAFQKTVDVSADTKDLAAAGANSARRMGGRDRFLELVSTIDDPQPF